MIVYRSTTSAFLDTVFKHDIEAVIRVAAEYRIPQTSKRIDMLLSGLDDAGRHTLVIVELKQWEHASRTPMDGVVRTRFAGGNADASRPSYQSWSYAEPLRNFNATVDEADVPLQPCAYLHNCTDGAELRDEHYKFYVSRAPLFLAGDEERAKLRGVIARHVRKPAVRRIVVRLDASRTATPSRLQEHVLLMPLQETALPVGERPDFDSNIRSHAHPLERWPVSHRRHEQSATAPKGDEAAVEQMVDSRCQQ